MVYCPFLNVKATLRGKCLVMTEQGVCVRCVLHDSLLFAAQVFARHFRMYVLQMEAFAVVEAVSTGIEERNPTCSWV